MWILLTVSIVYGGYNIHTQEFKTKDNCENVVKALKEISKSNTILIKGCFKK